jgi:hypothetical protein
MQTEATTLPGSTEIYKDLQWPEGHELLYITAPEAIPAAFRRFLES